MTTWSPRDPLPSQIADAFAVMYDWFERSYFTPSEDDESYSTLADNDDWWETAARSSHVERLINEVMDSDSATPSLLQEVLDQACDDPDPLEMARQVYYCLYAIDRGLKYQTPRSYASPARPPGYERTALLGRFDSVSRYNDETPGYVLPKWTERHRGTEFAEHFQHLVRANVDRNEVRIIGRNARARSDRATGDRTLRNPKVVVVPFLYRMFDDGSGSADAKFSELKIGDTEYFEVVHRATSSGVLEDRIRLAVREIRESQATVAIFPELSLTDHLRELLSDELDRTRTELALASDKEDPLEWVIAGVATPATRRKPWANEAYVMNSAGNLVSFDSEKGETHWWRQKKRHRYKLTVDEQKKYGTDACFANACDRLEAINIGRHCFVFEDRTGRYAIVICEDLAQEQRTMDLLRKMLCRVIFVILMDGPMVATRWASVEGEKVASQTGSIVVVANSLLIPNIEKNRRYQIDREQDKEIVRAFKEKRTPRTIVDPYPLGKQPVGLIIDPPWEDRKFVTRTFLTVDATPPPTAGASTVSEAGEVQILKPPPAAKASAAWRLLPP
jgi:predicted amidohydrolase